MMALFRHETGPSEFGERRAVARFELGEAALGRGLSPGRLVEHAVEADSTGLDACGRDGPPLRLGESGKGHEG